jgi:hypothetical protein
MFYVYIFYLFPHPPAQAIFLIRYDYFRFFVKNQ